MATYLHNSVGGVIKPKISARRLGAAIGKPVSQSRELVPVETPKRAYVKNPPDTDKIITIFEKRQRELHELIESGTDNESTTLMMARTMAQAILNSLPNFEEKLKNGSGRDAYAFVALCDMMLKLSNELRALQDRNAMSKIIMGEILRPQLETMATRISAGINQVKLKLPEGISRSALDHLDGVKRAAIAEIGKTYIETGASLNKYFGGSGLNSEGLDLDDEQ